MQLKTIAEHEAAMAYFYAEDYQPSGILCRNCDNELAYELRTNIYISYEYKNGHKEPRKKRRVLCRQCNYSGDVTC
jgi:hypothetical protein